MARKAGLNPGSVPFFNPPFHLLIMVSSEQISDNPWKLLIATMLLNKTTGKAAIPIFWKILKIWPTPLLMNQGVLYPSASFSDSD